MFNGLPENFNNQLLLNDNGFSGITDSFSDPTSFFYFPTTWKGFNDSVFGTKNFLGGSPTSIGVSAKKYVDTTEIGKNGIIPTVGSYATSGISSLLFGQPLISGVPNIALYGVLALVVFAKISTPSIPSVTIGGYGGGYGGGRR